MSTLALSLSAAWSPDLEDSGAPQWSWALQEGPSLDGEVTRTGLDAAAQLPPASLRVGVLAPEALSWHRVTLPKVPAGKLKAALQGLLEEQLLSDPEDLHWALAPGAKAGATAWVAVTLKAPLRAQLQALAAAGVTLDRLVPAWSPALPGGTPCGHWRALPGASGAPTSAVELLWSSPDEAGRLPITGPASRALHWVSPLIAAHPKARWTAEPGALKEAEAVLGQAPMLRSAAQGLLDAVQQGVTSGWELRQFDLTDTQRGRAGWRWWRQAWTAPALRPWRWGLAALLLVQLGAVLVAAWQQQGRLADLKRQQVAVLQTTFPHVKSVLDAPLQMQREAETWLTARGLTSGTDLESALATAARAWPEGAAAATRAVYGRQGLQLQVSAWSPTQRQAFVSAVVAQGWQAQSQEQGGALVWTLRGGPR